MSTRQPFSTAYYPPVPVLDVWLSAPAEQTWSGPFSAIVDTGADATVVPLYMLESLRPPIVRPAMLTSHWQDAHRVYVYEIDLRSDQGVLPAVDVAGDPLSTEILLGRNILNRLDLRLEGPAQITHLLA